MFVYILWFAILQGNGEFATFSAQYPTLKACQKASVEAQQVDLSSNDAVMRHIECVKVDATPLPEAK